jgi:soluble lytic murein transglycosylase-like protein
MYIIAVKADFPEKGETIVEQHLADISDFPISENYLVSIGNPVYQKEPCLYNLINQYNWNAKLMYAIMMAESGGNPNIVNKRDYHRSSNCYGSYGAFQIGCGWFGKYGLTKENVFDPATNIRVAYEIFKTQGLRAWGVYTNGAYKKFYY